MFQPKIYTLLTTSHQKQGFKGIRQWSFIQYTSLMMIHNITPSVDDNKWRKRLDTELNEPTKIQKKSPKLLGQRI